MLTEKEIKEILKNYLDRSSMDTGGNSLACFYFPEKDIEESYKDFFEFMSESGYKQFVSKSYLREVIVKYGKKTGDKIKKFLTEIKDIHELSDDDIEQKVKVFVSKWKGNVFEMIVLQMLSHYGTAPFLQNTKIESWPANAKDDNGSDGYLVYNDKRLVGVNVKFRYRKEIDDNSKVLKTPVRTMELMADKRRKGEINKDVSDDWLIQEVKTLCFTSTRPTWFMDEEKLIKWITEKEIYEQIGYVHSGSDDFWKSLYDIIK